MKIKDKVINALKGFFIGVAFLIPGVSGATIALVTKIYDKLINSLSNIIKDFLNSMKVLLPIGIGVLIAIVAMWIPLKLATEHILFAIVCLFAGSMLGSIPDVASNIKFNEIKKRNYLYLLIAILIGMSLGIISYFCNLNVSNLFNPIAWQIYLIIIPVGFLASAGIVVPGISGSMLLLVLGFYNNILGMFSNNNILQCLLVLFLMAIGVLLGIIFFSKLMKYLLNRYKDATYVWIIGLVFGSLFSLFYNQQMMNYYSSKGVSWWEGLLAAILLIIGFIVSYYLFIYQRKNKLKKDEIR